MRGGSFDDCAAGPDCGSAYVFRCLPEGTCPDAVDFIEPESGTVDARQPLAAHDPSSLMGIDTILVQGTPGSEVLECWSLCESDDGGAPNSITSLATHGDGTQTLHPGAIQTLVITCVVAILLPSCAIHSHRATSNRR